MNPSIRHLRAFVVLAEQKNFTRASEISHLSQPAFSALIAGLESALDLRLFDRNTRSVALTVEGEQFEASARRLVQDFDTALASARDQATRRSGQVSVALLPSLAAGWFPPVLSSFHTRFPGIRLEVSDLLSDACIARVASGEADFALASVQPQTPWLQARCFCEDDFYLVCPLNHPLTLVKNLRPANLGSWPFIHLVRDTSVRQCLDAALHPVKMQTLVEVEHMATVAGMVRAGLGISVVPALTLFHFDDPACVTRPLKLRGLRRQLYLITRRDRSLSVAAQGLYDHMLEHRPAGVVQPSETATLKEPIPKVKRGRSSR